mgnify:CR=1 FL=1
MLHLSILKSKIKNPNVAIANIGLIVITLNKESRF